jgi:hypothetical protein
VIIKRILMTVMIDSDGFLLLVYIAKIKLDLLDGVRGAKDLPIASSRVKLRYKPIRITSKTPVTRFNA